MRARRKPLAILIPALLIGLVMQFIVPSQHVPWKRLDLDRPIGMATGTKITMIALRRGTKCMDVLASAKSGSTKSTSAKPASAKSTSFTRAEPKHDGKSCGWDVAVDIQSLSGIHFRPATVTAQCPLMLAGYIWLRDVSTSAEKYLGSPLKRVHHAGTYACRRQRGNSSGEWSEHAFANAWDVTGFELENGQVISVLKDWDGGKSRTEKNKAKFLRKARGSACRLFRVVLSPDYNAAHKDHFHLDQGPSLSCR